MSSQDSSKKPSSTQAEHLNRSEDCALEAAQLLNCVASKKYSKDHCIALLDSLRACVKKHGVVDFTLIPDKETEDSSSKAASKKSK